MDEKAGSGVASTSSVSPVPVLTPSCTAPSTGAYLVLHVQLGPVQQQHLDGPVVAMSYSLM